MAKQKLDVGGFVASLNQTLTTSSTVQPQLQEIDIDQLDANEANFYAVDVSKLDTLGRF